MKARRAYAKQASPDLSLRRKAALLDVHLSGLYYKEKPPKKDEVDLMNDIQDLYSRHPFMGYRRITIFLKRMKCQVNAKRVLRLMRVLGLQALYPKKNLSKRRQEDAVYPYLLKDTPPIKPNDVWQVDITYIRMQQGFLYLTALIDVISRRVMGWHLSPFLETLSCIEALENALAEGFKPLILNSDQGCQFTSAAWINILTLHSIVISMDGKGRCLDNIFIERFWRTLKYEEVYLKTYESVNEARQAIGAYITWYNTKRPHQVLNYQTPDEVFFQELNFEEGKKDPAIFKSQGVNHDGLLNLGGKKLSPNSPLI